VRNILHSHGISLHITVSLVLRNIGAVSGKSREHISKAVRRLLKAFKETGNIARDGYFGWGIPRPSPSAQKMI